jgi:pimeloyl-ACP methyl ester carboxylesterase
MVVETFVLVHGTGHGGWCWQKVARAMRASGSDVYAQTLTGLGDRAHLIDCGVDLTTHVTDVSSLLFYEDLSDVVLVGHSYAGMVITGVAATVPDRLKQLVYLDAYVPDTRRPRQIDLWPPEMRARIEAEASSNRGLRLPPSPELMGITDPLVATWAQARITPHPMSSYTQAAPPGGARSSAIARAYIHCTEGPMAPVFAPFADTARAEGWVVREMPTGHDAMLVAPEALAELLLDLAREV